MTMNAQTKSYKQVNKVAKNFVKKDATPTSFLKTSLKAVRPMADVPEGYAQVTLTAGDVWQDGTGYQMLLDADATAYGTIIPETGGLNTSGDVPAETYAEFEYKIPENADGALATANIVINSSVTITIPAGTYDWCITNPTPGARMWIASENGTIGGRYNDFEFVSGVAYEFIVSLGGQNDQVDLIDSNTPSVPTDVFVTPTATTGDVAWTPGDNNNTWNLRWRPWTDPALMNRDWSDMNVDNYLDIAGEFMIYDADGDGKSTFYIWRGATKPKFTGVTVERNENQTNPPTITVENGKVVMTCGTAGASIYYATATGVTPSTGTLYSAPLATIVTTCLPSMLTTSQ